MRKNLFLLLLCILLVLFSLNMGSKKGNFEGADVQVEGKITEINNDYKPWFNSIWEPPSGEVESMIFALQAALGAGFVGYYIGRKKNVQNSNRIRKEQQTV